MTQTDERYELRPRRWKRSAGLALLVIVLAPVGLHWWWGSSAQRLLDVQIEQYRLAGEPVTVLDLIPMPVADEDNAALDLRAAGEAIDAHSDLWRQFDNLQTQLPLTDEELDFIRQVLEENREALARVEAATEKSGIDWDLDLRSPMINIDLRFLNPQRSLANLLRGAAIEHHASGDDAAAMRRVRQMLFVSDAVNHVPTLVAHLTAVGISALGCEAVIEIAPDVRIDDPAAREQMALVIHELLDEQAMRQGQRHALRGERVLQLDSVFAVLDGRLGEVETPVGHSGLAGRVLRPMFLTDARLMMQHMANVMEAAEAPAWPAFLDRLPQEIPDRVAEHPRRHLLASILLPSLEGAVEVNYRIQADRRLAATALAVRWHAAEHEGRLPESLDDLVPAYLPDVPVDPLDPDGGAIRYLPDPERPILYSVGADGIDHGGSETLTRGHYGGRPSRWIMEDAVVHLSRQPRVERDDEQWEWDE